MFSGALLFALPRYAMIDQVSQREFNQMIMLVAFAMCFRPNEEYLSEDQIIDRGYSPTESYGRNCIAKLIDDGAVAFKHLDPTFPFDTQMSTLFVKRPVSLGKELEPFIYRHFEKIQRSIDQSFDCNLYLAALYQDVLACEAIEYANFYAQKNGFNLLNAAPTNAKLKLLLIENSPEKTNAFIWRAIKNAKKKIGNSVEHVEFSDVVNAAFDCYVRYQKLNIEIEGYNRPSQLKTSLLSSVLEFIRLSKGAKAVG